MLENFSGGGYIFPEDLETGAGGSVLRSPALLGWGGFIHLTHVRTWWSKCFLLDQNCGGGGEWACKMEGKGGRARNGPSDAVQVATCAILGRALSLPSFLPPLQKLLKISEQSWSLAELVHAVVLLAHFHALTSFALGCGQDTWPEGWGMLKLALPGSLCFCEVGNGSCQELQHLNRKRVRRLAAGRGCGGAEAQC